LTQFILLYNLNLSYIGISNPKQKLVSNKEVY
jgi:hypothetical protein